MPFDYANKGRNIPPPKDRMPNPANYVEIEPSPDAHIIQEAPEGYQQYQMTEEEYAAAIHQQQMMQAQ